MSVGFNRFLFGFILCWWFLLLFDRSPWATLVVLIVLWSFTLDYSGGSSGGSSGGLSDERSVCRKGILVIFCLGLNVLCLTF